MNFRGFIAVSALLVAPACVAQQDASPTSAGRASAPLQITQKTEVPGTSLRPGSYTIRVADSLHDRVIVQVLSADGGSRPAASFLGYPNPKLDTTATSGAVPFDSGLKGKPALRGFSFSDGTKIEFVYPKADAVALAKANGVRVMAVDPASEGKVNLPNLSQQDMAEVTLWLLTPTPVDPSNGGKPGIQAAKYQAPAAPPQPTYVAQASTPAPPVSTPQADDSATSAPPAASAPPARVSSASSAPVQMASNSVPPAPRRARQLPHTASNEPLIWLLAFLSFGVAGFLSLRRLSTSGLRG